jgi:hypothetical protein
MGDFNPERARECDHSQHAEIPRDYPNRVVFVCANCGAQVDAMSR